MNCVEAFTKVRVERFIMQISVLVATIQTRSLYAFTSIADSVLLSAHEALKSVVEKVSL